MIHSMLSVVLILISSILILGGVVSSLHFGQKHSLYDSGNGMLQIEQASGCGTITSIEPISISIIPPILKVSFVAVETFFFEVFSGLIPDGHCMLNVLQLPIFYEPSFVQPKSETMIHAHVKWAAKPGAVIPEARFGYSFSTNTKSYNCMRTLFYRR